MLLVKISGTNVNIRAEPFRNGRVLGRFAGGEHAVVLEERPGPDAYPWSLLIGRTPLPDGPLVEGWVYGQFVEPLPQQEWNQLSGELQGGIFSAFFEKTIDRFGGTPEETVSKFGAPSFRKDTRVPGRHDPDYKVDFSELHYPGLELLFFRTADSDGLIGVKLSQGDALLGEGLGLGAPALQVFRELGVPQYQQGSVFGWSDDSGYANLFVTFSGGRVILVDFSVDLD
jgi:hypothetical protein